MSRSLRRPANDESFPEEARQGRLEGLEGAPSSTSQNTARKETP